MIKEGSGRTERRKGHVKKTEFLLSYKTNILTVIVTPCKRGTARMGYT